MILSFIRRELDIEGVKALTLDEALSREDVHVIVVATENSSHYDITKYVRSPFDDCFLVI